MKTALRLRAARDSDWPAVAALLDDNHLPTAGARENLGNFVVATLQGSIVACAGLEIFGSVALLRSVAVAPLLHRRGIGAMLVGETLALAQGRGAGDIYLLTVSAAEYFARYGFVPVQREAAPAALQASAEFQGACPATAALFHRSLPVTASPPPRK